ncbi:plasmalemma vesicle associated protein a [Sparus aurata]|uniref:Plasmalemma vesicle associated protein a n=1 Tax=Sparus aurata TaxID=8175 RepID=A0A671U045_SPAAU|nr:keratin, type I cytoskeletal 9-like [Sparus aurata]
MYSSGYSQVSKYSPQAQKKMQYRSKGKSCGYYMRIVFFFSSLIQSLIIVSLVLFLIYGKKQDSASTSRILDLEESFSRLSIENVALRHQRKNLTTLLNSTLTEKARNDWDLVRLRHFSNISMAVIQELDKKLQQCNRELFLCKGTPTTTDRCTRILPGPIDCGRFSDQQRAKLELVESNFTQTVQRMRMELDQTAKERDNLNLEAIRLRRDKSTHEKEVQIYRQRCKEDFVQSLSGVSNVTTTFLEKIDSLFSSHNRFQLTCPKQSEHLEQIRTNCSSLSREVEDRFQRYLNSVADQVSRIQGENSRLKAENWRLSEDYRWCSQNRTDLIKDNKKNLEKLQSKHDEDKERLLMDKMRLNGDIQVLENNVNYKNKEIEHIREQLKQLNMTCMAKAGLGGYPGGSTSQGSPSQSGWGSFGGGGSSSSSSSSSNGGQPSRTGLVPSFGSAGTGLGSSLFQSRSSSSTGSGLNKLGSTGTGSSSSSIFSSGSSSSTGSGLNKLGSTGTGSSSSSIFSPGSSSSSGSAFNRGTGSSSSSIFSSGSSSSTGSGLNKIGSTGGGTSNLGSTGLNPSLSSTGRSSSAIGSSSGSTGSSFGSSLNKPTTNVKSSSGLGLSSGSTGSMSKSGSSGSAFSWLGLGNSNSGQSKTGSGTGKGTSTGSATGTGRTSGLVGGSVSIAQHLQDLQHLINPAGPEEKQDLSRMLG